MVLALWVLILSMGNHLSLLVKIEAPPILGKIKVLPPDKPHKRQHKSAKQAAEHLAKLTKKSPERTFGIYFCKKCGSYHVTSHGIGDKKYIRFIK